MKKILWTSGLFWITLSIYIYLHILSKCYANLSYGGCLIENKHFLSRGAELLQAERMTSSFSLMPAKKQYTWCTQKVTRPQLIGANNYKEKDIPWDVQVHLKKTTSGAFLHEGCPNLKKDYFCNLTSRSSPLKRFNYSYLEENTRVKGMPSNGCTY